MHSTIQLSQQTKQRLRQLRKEKESYDETLQRLITFYQARVVHDLAVAYKTSAHEDKTIDKEWAHTGVDWE